MGNTIKYFIEILYDNGWSKNSLLRTKYFNSRTDALDWYRTSFDSFVAADVWKCTICLVSAKNDDDGREIEISRETLFGF